MLSAVVVDVWCRCVMLLICWLILSRAVFGALLFLIVCRVWFVFVVYCVLFVNSVVRCLWFVVCCRSLFGNCCLLCIG